MKIFFFLVTMTLSVISFASQGKGKSPELKVALSSFPQSLKNPFFATDSNSQNVHRLVHISLTDIGPNMDFACRLCESYEEEVKGNKHHLVFKLKKGLKFWDGEEVDAVCGRRVPGRRHRAGARQVDRPVRTGSAPRRWPHLRGGRRGA